MEVRTRIKPLLFWNFLALLLLASFFLLEGPWSSLDLSFFRLVNEPLKNQMLRKVTALANHSMADWIEDLCILAFYTAAILKTKRGERLKRGAEFIFCILLTAATILLINRVFFRDILHLRRMSPSMSLPHFINISKAIPGFEFKVLSNKSFPGDHATTALMFAISYAYVVRGRLAVLALFYGALLCLPRLAVGAHWLSDLIVGSGCIVMLSMSWAFFTPLADRTIGAIWRGLKKIWPTKASAG